MKISGFFRKLGLFYVNVSRGGAWGEENIRLSAERVFFSQAAVRKGP